jgi:hypothetical protein
MAGSQHNTKSLAGAQTTLIGSGQRKVIAIYVTKAGASGSLLNLRNGTTNGAAIEFTVEGEAVNQLPIINRTFGAGLYAEVITGGSYLIIYE